VNRTRSGGQFWKPISPERGQYCRPIHTHLEIRSIRPERARLPTTETGYRSHFQAPGTVEALGGDVVAQVIAWLDEEARTPDWQRYADASRQGKLF